MFTEVYINNLSTNLPTLTLFLFFRFPGSPWRDKISLAILELQEKGTIQMLYDKWWKNTGDVCNRDDKNKESKANALGVENIGKSLDFFFLLSQ